MIFDYTLAPELFGALGYGSSSVLNRSASIREFGLDQA